MCDKVKYIRRFHNFHKTDYLVYLPWLFVGYKCTEKKIVENFSKAVKFVLDRILTSITGPLHKKNCTFSKISR